MSPTASKEVPVFTFALLLIVTVTTAAIVRHLSESGRLRTRLDKGVGVRIVLELGTVAPTSVPTRENSMRPPREMPDDARSARFNTTLAGRIDERESKATTRVLDSVRPARRAGRDGAGEEKTVVPSPPRQRRPASTVGHRDTPTVAPVLMLATPNGGACKVVGTVVIGRDRDADLPIDDPSVSKRHARVAREGTVVRLLDLGSTNGTFLNGTLVRDALLEIGDTVQLGHTAEVRVVAETVA
jgi:hypothetical protein